METTNNETRKIILDNNTIWHRMNNDGTATLYVDGTLKKVIPELEEKLPGHFNIMTDPEEDGPLMVIVDPERVSFSVLFGSPKVGFQIADPCAEDCERCENRDECENRVDRKEDTDE